MGRSGNDQGAHDATARDPTSAPAAALGGRSTSSGYGSAARTAVKGAVHPTIPPCARTISSVAALKAAK